MKEIILCKYGEIVLKGLNKRQFEAVMLRQLSHRIAPLGKFEITSAQSVAYIEPTDEECDIDAAYDAVCKIFGIVSVCRAAVTEKNFDSIVRTVGEYILPAIRERGAKTLPSTCMSPMSSFTWRFAQRRRTFISAARPVRADCPTAPAERACCCSPAVSTRPLQAG